MAQEGFQRLFGILSQLAWSAVFYNQIGAVLKVQNAEGSRCSDAQVSRLTISS